MSKIKHSSLQYFHKEMLNYFISFYKLISFLPAKEWVSLILTIKSLCWSSFTAQRHHQRLPLVLAEAADVGADTRGTLWLMRLMRLQRWHVEGWGSPPSELGRSSRHEFYTHSAKEKGFKYYKEAKKRTLIQSLDIFLAHTKLCHISYRWLVILLFFALLFPFSPSLEYQIIPLKLPVLILKLYSHIYAIL